VGDEEAPGRVEEWAEERPARIRGHNPWLVLVRIGRRFVEVRVTGLAAEMTYYGLLSLVPLLVALGAGLGLLERVLGPEQVLRVENAMIAGLEVVFSPDLTQDVMAPLVRGLLHEERTGLAIGSLIVTFWLASRVFRAAIRALDDAYRVEERRRLLTQVGLAYVFALGMVVVSALVMSMVVVGPLLGGGRALAEWLGVGRVFEVAWGIGRWPLLFVIGAAFLTWLYRTRPNVRNTWRECVPGAVVGAVGMVLVAVGFRVYLELAGPQAPQLGDAQEAVQVAAQTVGAVLATVLFAWLTSIVILLGGVVNAELAWSADDGAPERSN
jgi:membrane protein